MKDSGSVAPQFLFVLVFLSLLAVSLARYLSATAVYERTSRRRFASQAELMDAALTLLAALKEDPTPEADGRADPVQEMDGRTIGGIKVGAADISSAINVNFVRKNVFEKTDLSALLAVGASSDELQQYREDEGLSTSIFHYARFFRPEDFGRKLTVYGWANINLTDEFALSSLAASLSGSTERGEALRMQLRPLLVAKTLVTRDGLATFLGAQYDRYFPVISAEGSMNVNFVDPLVLRELFAYPDYGLESPGAKAERILEEREIREIDEGSLKSILGVEDHRLLHYFGCRTWFWELSAEREGRRCVLIVCRYPDGNLAGGLPAATGEDEPRFEILETRFE